MDRAIRIFWWTGSVEKNKFLALMSWDSLCQPKYCRGLAFGRFWDGFWHQDLPPSGLLPFGVNIATPQISGLLSCLGMPRPTMMVEFGGVTILPYP
ncbi:hypothetical protein PanWU01x14_000710 [Parasponia andersonii]|uniref:Uncharacterized protein n=1 Tax=Parasponia andersonii TaxID=3476 RepID=A0A2P5E4P7_PARAD|nr:hypothetical protein PanWU01x14_000710 [Parasponia andersonii]